jgi:PPOX class probable F420-dependent enzyme
MVPANNGEKILMNAQEMQAFLSARNNAIIGVNRPNSGPQLTPVWYVWDGEAFYFSTTKDRSKYPNIKRDPSITLIVDDVASHQYLVAYGRAEIIEQNVAELSRPLIEKYMPNNVEQGMKMVSDPSRVLIVLRPEKILTH